MVNAQKRVPSPIEQTQRRERVGVRSSTTGGGAVRRLSHEDERLLKQILAKAQDYIDSEVFYEDGAEKSIYDDAPPIQQPDTTWYHPVMDDYSGSRTRSVKSSQQVILTAAEERVLFHQFNYARHRVRLLQDDIWAGTAARTGSASRSRRRTSRSCSRWRSGRG